MTKSVEIVPLEAFFFGVSFCSMMMKEFVPPQLEKSRRNQKRGWINDTKVVNNML